MPPLAHEPYGFPSDRVFPKIVPISVRYIELIYLYPRQSVPRPVQEKKTKRQQI